MGFPMKEHCTHDRVVRLPVQGCDYWICNLCNEQFVQKKQVDWRIKHLAAELQRAIAEGTVNYEQAAGMWREESV